MCDSPKKVLKEIRDASEGVSGRIELLVSSTHTVDISEVLSPVLVDTYSSRAEIDIDMIAYITREVQEREEHEKLLKGRYPAIEEKLVEILFRRAGGMYDHKIVADLAKMLTVF